MSSLKGSEKGNEREMGLRGQQQGQGRGNEVNLYPIKNHLHSEIHANNSRYESLCLGWTPLVILALWDEDFGLRVFTCFIRTITRRNSLNRISKPTWNFVETLVLIL